MDDFLDDMYIKIKLDRRTYNIIMFHYIPLQRLVKYYERIEEVEDFTKQTLNLIHLGLKNPKDFASIKQTITFEEAIDFMNRWVKYSTFYGMFRNGEINSDGEMVKHEVGLKTALSNMITLIESDNVTDEEEHLVFIEMLSHTMKKHINKYNKTAEKKITQITVSPEND